MSADNGKPRQVLVVDDDPNIALLLSELLETEGHDVSCAHDGVEALAAVAERPPDLILLDLDMPHLGGFEVCRLLKSDPRTRLIPVVIVTGQTAQESRLQAWDLGADEFLTKPFHRLEVIARCQSLLRLKALTDALDGAESVVFALARAIEAKNRYTQGHSERVTAFALALADRLGLARADRDVLHRGGLLHDLGKLAVPDEVLNKPGPLTAAEFDTVKMHPVVGERIVEPLRSVRDIIPLIRWHHERLDGSGYPDGLTGDAIPPLVRLLAVADVYDALASARPYRSALSLEECLQTLHAEAAAGRLDRELVIAFSAAPAIPLLAASTNMPLLSGGSGPWSAIG
jgi:putative two-component system response regulator